MTCEVRKDLPGFKEFANRFLLHVETIPASEMKKGSGRNLVPLTEDKQFGVAHIVGTFTTHRGLNTWRILGLTHRRDDPEHLSSDLDVIRLQGQWKLADGTVVEETVTESKVEYILRLCRSDAPEAQKKFLEQMNIVKELRKINSKNKRQADCFPRFMASDKMTETGYLFDNQNYTRTFDSPRPFYIMEKIDPNLEVVMRSGTKKGIGAYASVFLTMGILNALRYLHHSGYIHRNVQPSEFAVRLGPKGKLCRSESELSYSVAFCSFSLCCKRDRVSASFDKKTPLGFPMYNSPAAMKGAVLSPVDDCISAMYIFYEMVSNERLPWTKVDDREVRRFGNEEVATMFRRVLAVKQDFEKTAEDIKSSFQGVQDLFKEIRKSNGYNIPVDYDAVIEILRHGLAHTDDDIKDLTVFGYQQATMMAFRHGIEYKDNTKTNVVVERDDAVSRINLLYPNTELIEKDDKKEKTKPTSAKKKK